MAADKKKKSLLSRIVYWAVFVVCVYFGVSALSYAEPLKFAQISDVHLSDKTVDTSYKVLSHTPELFKDEIDCDIHIVVSDKEEKLGLMNLKML